MSYRSLLLHLDTDPACAARTQAALRLAQALEAHLVGLAPTGSFDVPPALGGEVALGQLAEIAWQALRQQATEAVESFRRACLAAGAISFEARIDEGDRAASLVRHAHASDLCILGQADPREPSHGVRQALLEQVVLYSARPTLIVPYVAGPSTLGERVLVAWDDSREAARAVADALPLLRRAQRVSLLSWAEHGDVDDGPLHTSADATLQWLQRHGVSADWQLEHSPIGVAESMLSRAADLGTDLIVMGAWGHARWAERVLGGATRVLLDTMTVPVLMSH